MHMSKAVKHSGSQEWNQAEVKKFFQEEFTVKDVLRMFHLALRNRDFPESPESSYDLRLQALLTDIEANFIMSDIELAKGLNGTRTTTKRSDDILAVPSDSVSDLSAFAVSDTPLQQEEVLVPKEENDAYARMIAHSATLPNSVYKRPPTELPPPMKSWHVKMTSRSQKVYQKVYGENNPWVSWEFPFAPEPHPIRKAELVRPPPPVDPRLEKLKAKEAEKAKKKGKK